MIIFPCFFLILFVINIISSNESVLIASPEKEAESIKNLAVTPVQPTAPSCDDSFQLIIGLLDLLQEQVQPVTSTLSAMFVEWHVANWSDLSVFNEKDVNSYIKTKKPQALTPPKISKQLGFIIAYACIGSPIDSSTTMNDIVRDVDNYQHMSTKPSLV